MTAGRHRTIALRAAGAAMLAALLVAGCGGDPHHDAPAGMTVLQSGIAYSVQSSRELDPLEPDDRALFTGVAPGQPLDAPHEVLLGVFVQARNVARRPRRAVAAPQLVSTLGATFRPLALPASDPFAYRGGPLAPGAQLPDPASAPAEGPDGGAVIVYRVPDTTFATDRPFTIQFGRGDRAASVQLDV